MRNEPTYPSRKSIRLAEYDYSNEGAIFVTICAYNRMSIFGRVIDGKMRLNEIGEIVKTEWGKTPGKRPNISLDRFVVMPNHLHGIMVVDRRGELNSFATRHNQKREDGRMQYAPTSPNKFQSPKQSIGSIIRGFKSSTTRQIRGFLNDPSFSVWQRNYYEHVIRNDDDMFEIQTYIENNPTKWTLDRYFTRVNPLSYNERMI